MSNLLNKRRAPNSATAVARLAQVSLVIVFLALNAVGTGWALRTQALDSTSAVDLQVLATSIASDSSGNIYYVDTAHSRIYKVSSTGVQAQIQCCAGTSIVLNQPRGLAVDSQGNLYIANTGNNQVIELNSSGQASIVNTGFYRLSRPSGVTVDSNGDIYIADSGDDRILEVPAAGAQAFEVGTGSYQLSNPSSVSVSQDNTLYITDTWNNRIVAVPASGNPSVLYSNQLHGPMSMSIDNAGNAYIAQTSTDTPSQNSSNGNGQMPAVVSSFSGMNLNVTAGGSQESIASANITLTPLGGFNGTVSLSVVGLPPNVLMQLSHPIVSFSGNGPVADLLQIGENTAAQQSHVIITGVPHSTYPSGRIGLVFAGLLPFSVFMLIGFRSSSRNLARTSKIFGVLTIFLLLPVLTVTTSSCAGGYPAGLFGDATYTATLIAKPTSGQPYSLGSFGITVLQ